jgi:hypothetical protein
MLLVAVFQVLRLHPAREQGDSQCLLQPVLSETAPAAWMTDIIGLPAACG